MMGITNTAEGLTTPDKEHTMNATLDTRDVLSLALGMEVASFRTLGPVCTDCVAPVVSDDYDDLEDDTAATVEATLGAIRRDEGFDALTVVMGDGSRGYFRCLLCGDDAIGGSAELVGVCR